MVRLTESRIRQIIKEEIQRESLRVMTQRERHPEALEVMPYTVSIDPTGDRKADEELALQAAMDRAAEDYPETEWELEVGGPAGRGPRQVRSPRPGFPRAAYVVYLRNLGPAEDFSRVPGGDQFAQSMEDYGDMDIDLDR